jgi:hypothetical protein
MIYPTSRTTLATKFTYLIAVAAAFAAVGCKDTTSPESVRLVSTARVFDASDNSSWTVSSFNVDYIRYDVACLGEPMRFVGPNYFRYHQVTSDAGNYHYHFQILAQTPNLPSFVGIGQTTGRVFTYKNGGPYNEIFHIGPGQSLSILDHELYQGSDGTILEATFTLHFTENANGVITADKSDPASFSCR